MKDNELLRDQGGDGIAPENPEEEKSWAEYDRAADEQEKREAEAQAAAEEASSSPASSYREPEDGKESEEERKDPDGTDEPAVPPPDGSYEGYSEYEVTGEYDGFAEGAGSEEESPEEDPAEYGPEEEPEFAGYDEDQDPSDYYAEEDGYGAEDKPENLAEIAERILGARHSKASTAAPIRTRGERDKQRTPEEQPKDGTSAAILPPAVPAVTPGPVSDQAENPAGPDPGVSPVPPPQPNAGGVSGNAPNVPPVNPGPKRRRPPFVSRQEREALEAERQAAAEEAERRAKEAEARAKRKRLTTGIVAVCVIALLLAGVWAAVSIANRNKPADTKTADPAVSEEPVTADQGVSGGGTEAQTGENAENAENTENESENTGDPAENPGEDNPGTEPQSGDGENLPENGEENPGTGETDAQSGEENPADQPGETEPATGTEPEGPSETPDPGKTEEDPGTKEPGPAEPVKEPVPTGKKITVRFEFFGREPFEVETEPKTLGEILADRGITLAEGEMPSVSQNERISENTTVTVDRYEYKDFTETVAVPFEREEIGVDTIPRGSTSLIQEGKDGEKTVHTVVAFRNGVEFDRHLDREEVTAEPVNEQVYVGVGGSLVGRDGQYYTYSWRRVCPATTYNDPSLTWLGNYAGPGTAAASFDNIPLGTRIYLRNDRYDFGVCEVQDTGERFDPWQVDIWMDYTDPNYPLMSKEGYVYDMVVYFLD